MFVPKTAMIIVDDGKKGKTKFKVIIVIVLINII